MTAALRSDAANSRLQHAGNDAIIFDATGITQGAGRRLAQLQVFSLSALATGTTLIPADDTIPQITEGDQYLSGVFTPTLVGSLLEIEVIFFAASSAGSHIAVGLFQDAIANALAVGWSTNANATYGECITFKHYITTASLATATFRVRAGPHAAATITVNGSGGGRFYGGTMSSRIIIREYLP